MLKDKYTFKHGKKSACELLEVLTQGVMDNKTTLYVLCMMTLIPFIEKLRKHGNSFGESKMKVFSLNSKEALAFHLLYRNDYLDKENPFVKEIFTAVERSL